MYMWNRQHLLGAPSKSGTLHNLACQTAQPSEVDAIITPIFAEEGTETQRGYVSCPRTQVAEMGSEHR